MTDLAKEGNDNSSNQNNNSQGNIEKDEKGVSATNSPSKDDIDMEFQTLIPVVEANDALL